MNFEAYKNLNASVFYGELYKDIREQIGKIFQKREHEPSEVNIQYLITNIRKNPRFETLLMGIVSRDRGVDFNLDNEFISETATYGILAEGADGMCEVANPIYQYRIVKAFLSCKNHLHT